MARRVGGDCGAAVVPAVHLLEVPVFDKGVDDLPEPAVEAVLGNEPLAKGVGAEERSYSKP